jgi:hypothetical protein
MILAASGETLPADRVPKLVIISRRSWENAQVVDLRSAHLGAAKGHVENGAVAPIASYRRCVARRGC